MNICLTLLFHILHNIAFLEHIWKKTNPFFIHFILITPTMGISLIHNIAFVANTLNPRLLVFFNSFFINIKKNMFMCPKKLHCAITIRENGYSTTSLAIQFWSCNIHLQLTIFLCCDCCQTSCMNCKNTHHIYDAIHCNSITTQLQLYWNNLFSTIMQLNYNFIWNN